jgi:hypothetical protein
MNFKNTLISLSIFTLPALAFGQEVRCNSEGNGFGNIFSIVSYFEFDSPSSNFLEINRSGEFSKDDNNTYQSSVAVKPETDGSCKVTVTDSKGGKAKIILNVPKKLEAKVDFPASIENSGTNDIEAADKKLKCYFSPEVPAVIQQCKEVSVNGSDENQNLEPIELDVKNCKTDLVDNCIDKPDRHYCFVPLKCWAEKSGVDIEVSPFMFCHKRVFEKEYPNASARIKACIDDKGPLMEQKLEEFKASGIIKTLYHEPKSNNQ